MPSEFLDFVSSPFLAVPFALSWIAIGIVFALSGLRLMASLQLAALIIAAMPLEHIMSTGMANGGSTSNFVSEVLLVSMAASLCLSFQLFIGWIVGLVHTIRR